MKSLCDSNQIGFGRPNADPIPRLLVDSITAAEMLDISPRLLWDLTKQQIVPCRRIGRVLRYHVPELQEWIARGCPRTAWVPAPATNSHPSANGKEVGGG